MRRLILLLLLLQPFAMTFGQELWTGITFKYKISERFNLKSENELRFDEGVKSARKAFSEIQPGFALRPWFDIKPGYRFTYYDQLEHRLFLDLDFSFMKEKKFQTGLRLRTLAEDDAWQRKTFRPRASVKYNHSGEFKPYFDVESFHDLSDSTYPLNQMRFTLGVDLELLKWLDGTLFYRIDREMNERVNAQTHIIGTTLVVDLN